MGAALQRAGHEYAIFERADDLGGVWQHGVARADTKRRRGRRRTARRLRVGGAAAAVGRFVRLFRTF
jgi:cation diffusion facilitator CzcD-associated flavoprotein CzcO